MLYCFRKLPIKEYYYNRVLEELGLTKDEVIITVDKHMYPIIDNVVMAYIYSVSLKLNNFCCLSTIFDITSQ